MGHAAGDIGPRRQRRRRVEMRRRRRFARQLRTADTPRRRRRPARPAGRLRHPLRGGHFYPKPKTSRPNRQKEPRTPRMRPRRSVVDRVMPTSEPSAPRTIVRLRVVGLLVAALFALMFVRLWYLQVLDTSAYSQTVAQNHVRPVQVPSPRGLILDRSGSTLVGDTVTRNITLARVAAEQHPEVVGQLAALLGLTTTQINDDLNNDQFSLYEPVPILLNAPLSDVLYIGEHASMFPGVSVSSGTQLTYPEGETGAQMLGYVRQINSAELAAHSAQGYQLGDEYGQAGLENQYESFLRGTPGTNEVEVNAQGQVVGSLGQTQPRSGDNVVTNIDSGLEQTLQSALADKIKSLEGTVDASTGQVEHPTGGAAVALDPETGAVLALVSDPTYDPSIWNNSIVTQAELNQIGNGQDDNAIDGFFTPGSTFKLATATAALQTGLIGPTTPYYDDGIFTIPGCQTGGLGCKPLQDNDGENPHADIDVTQALTISSDDFFYNLGAQFWDNRGKYGPQPIQNTAAQYSFGQVTGIDLPGEDAGYYARVDSPSVVAKEHAQDPKDYPNGGWYTGNNVEMAFGQGGTAITPIEEAVAYATFANGGTRYQPQIAAGIVTSTGKVVRTFAPKVAGHVALSPADHQAMLAGFEGVVNDPSGTAFQSFAGFDFSKLSLAGKTGTASASEQVPTSWFVGWGPQVNPQYLIAVVIEKGGYGASAAAPVAEAGFSYLVANPVAPVVLSPPPGSGTSSSATSTPTPATGPGATSSTTSTSTAG
ncbi:MAG TPA: penicillin-binding transpeptidase domain-containing protein [Acidimicrobiales bacterium]|nr:penicillin-binding transpeptidase domain-containing protein [Acidimicrobiales bacterium]